MAGAETPAERRAREADLAAQERAGAPALVPVARTSPGYVHAVSPEHGERVVFVPGELLPGWAVEAIDGGKQATRDEQTGVLTLDVGVKARRKRTSLSHAVR